MLKRPAPSEIQWCASSTALMRYGTEWFQCSSFAQFGRFLLCNLKSAASFWVGATTKTKTVLKKL